MVNFINFVIINKINKMKSDIRKISVGRDYPNGVIHYQRGTKLNLAGTYYEITDILMDKELFDIGKLAYNIYIASPDTGKVLWKQVVDVPVIVENNINFD